MPTAWLNGLRCWGLWPAIVMALCRIEAALAANAMPEVRPTAMAFFGTLTVYGADRWLERRRLPNTAERHFSPLWMNGLFIVAIFVFGLSQLGYVRGGDWLWLLILGIGGALYLAVTVRLLPNAPFVKEMLGAFCFTYLIWGNQPAAETVLVVAFYATGLANFLLAGYQDRVRDATNRMNGTAIRWPRATVPIARGLALAAAIAALWWTRGLSTLGWMALAHAAWPVDGKHSIDGAFFPLLATPLHLFLRLG